MSPYIAAEIIIISIAKAKDIENGKTIPDDPSLAKYTAIARDRVSIKEKLDKKNA